MKNEVFLCLLRVLRVLVVRKRFAVKLYKKFVPYFSANFRFGHSISKELLKADTMEELRDNIDGVFERNPEIIARPNINLFL